VVGGAQAGLLTKRLVQLGVLDGASIELPGVTEFWSPDYDVERYGWLPEEDGKRVKEAVELILSSGPKPRRADWLLPSESRLITMTDEMKFFVDRY
jgi:hypothetical protein